METHDVGGRKADLLILLTKSTVWSLPQCRRHSLVFLGVKEHFCHFFKEYLRDFSLLFLMGERKVIKLKSQMLSLMGLNPRPPDD